MRNALLYVASLLPLAAQPTILPKGIVNSANFLPPGLPGGSIARGSMFTIFGKNLGPTTAAQQPSYPLQTTLAGVSVKITQGTTSVDALPAFVLNTQLNVIMPSNAPLGLASVRVTYNGQTSPPSPVRIVANSPGLFTSTGTGLGAGSVQNFVSPAVQPLNSPLRSAQPGQFVTLWATGLGAITQADSATPPVGNLPYQVEVFVGGQPATNFIYSGRTPCCAGIDQIVFQVPANAPSGCYVPVVARVAGSEVSNTVTMAIDPKGPGCTDSFNPIPATLVSGGNIAIVQLKREAITEDVLISPGVLITTDQAVAYFGQYTAGEYSFDPYMSVPPPGTCTTFASAGNPEFGAPRTTPKDLTAGTVSVSGPSGSSNLSSVTEDFRFDFSLLGLSPGLPGVSAVPLTFSPGNYKVSATGSADIGAFTTSLTVGSPLVWTNSSQTRIVDRSQPLQLNWTGGGNVLIRGGNRDYHTNAGAAFICNVPAGATSFTVPQYVMTPLPGTHTNYSDSEGYIEIHSLGPNSPQAITATKVTNGIAVVDFITRRSVIFR